MSDRPQKACQCGRSGSVTERHVLLGEIVDLSYEVLSYPMQRRETLEPGHSSQQATRESSEAETPASQYRPKDSRNRNLIDQLVNRVSSKLEEGDYIGAVRIACSEDVITEYSTEILEALTSKHLSHTLRLQLSAS